MTILVLQLDWEGLSQEDRFRAVTGFNEEEHAKFCAELLVKRTELYRPVAKTASDDLDYAYRVTNTVDVMWWYRSECLRNRLEYLGKTRGCRSTSVGDVLMRAGRAHVVSSFGFTDLTPLHPALEVALQALRAAGLPVDGEARP